MAKSLKFKNFIDSSGIVHERTNLKEYLKQIGKLMYPIGSIYLSINNTNPSSYFGGTWQQIGQGRTLVGVDTSQAEFNQIGKIGGNKNMQKHNHNITTVKSAPGNLYSTELVSGYNPSNVGTGVSTIAIHNYGTGDSGNLQPYLTCYMWQRTA